MIVVLCTNTAWGQRRRTERAGAYDFFWSWLSVSESSSSGLVLLFS